MSVAKQLIDDLVEKGCDYTLLFWLRFPHLLKDTELGTDFTLCLKKYKLTLNHFHPENKTFIHDFFTEVRKYFCRTGIIPINPHNYIIQANKGGKQAVLDKYKTVDWPRPRQPYCIQTMGGDGVLFMMYQTWQDAFIMQRETMQFREFVYQSRIISVHQIYEHQWGEGRLVRLMIDWEIMQSAYEDRLSLEEIKKIPDRFPEWFVSRLREERAIHSDTEVECIVKDKTRSKGDDLKLSRHFIFNIAAITMHGHYQAMCAVIHPWVARIQQFHKDKTLKGIDDKDIQSPVWGWDNRLLRGQNGIGTLFGRKPGETDAPYPTVPHRLILKPGSVACTKFAWCDKQHSVDVLGDKTSLVVLYHCSYSTPLATMVTYDPSFLHKIKVYIFQMYV